VITGVEAADMGLALVAVPRPEVLPRAQAYARQLAEECAPSSLRTVKRQVWEAMSSSLLESDRLATELMSQMIGAPDFAEGLAALAERRPPRFRGNR
jgi:enoyl-CoA hydratase/carnithine racemase